MNLWNKKDLAAPPTNTFKITNHNLDLKALLRILNEAEDTFNKQNYLEADAALLSRCIYRMKLKFRNDKGLKAMEKTNRALLQYGYLDILNVINGFKECIPLKYGKHETYLPTLNMLDFILIRIQGLSKLLCRIAECAKTAGYFLQNRIFIGHVWKVAFIAFALVSRIFVIAQFYTKFCCKFYNQLLSMRPHFENSGFQWLPKDYIYPEQLELWINADWLVDVIVLPVAINKFIIDDLSDSDLEFTNEYVDINDDIEIVKEYVDLAEDNHIHEIKDDLNKIDSFTKTIIKDTKTNINDTKTNINDTKTVNKDTKIIIKDTKTINKDTKTVIKDTKKINIVKQISHPIEFIDLDEDIGEIITKPKSKSTLKNIKIIDSIHSIESLRKFIISESKLHSKSSKDCKFRHLSKIEFDMLFKLINSFIIKANKKSMTVNSVLSKAKNALNLRIK